MVGLSKHRVSSVERVPVLTHSGFPNPTRLDGGGTLCKGNNSM